MYVKHRIQNFWKYFLRNLKDIETALDEQDSHQIKHIRNDLKNHLTNVCGCDFEMEKNEDGFYEWTFTPMGDRNAQMICALMKKDAPDTLRENWIINDYRPPLSDQAIHSYFQFKDVKLNGKDLIVYYQVNEASKTLDLKIYSDKWDKLTLDEKQQVCAYMLELYIGELEYEVRISSVEIVDQKQDEENMCLMINLYYDICDLIAENDWYEYHDLCSIYSVFKLDEMPTSKTLHKDMKMIITTHPELQTQLLNKELDCVKHFEQLGASFGYFYFEKMYEDEKEALLRQQLEKQINDLLYPMSIARTMGGAIGEYYTYIDVAVFDEDGFSIVLDKLKEALKFPIYYRKYLDEYK